MSHLVPASLLFQEKVKKDFLPEEYIWTKKNWAEVREGKIIML